MSISAGDIRPATGRCLPVWKAGFQGPGGRMGERGRICVKAGKTGIDTLRGEAVQ